MAKISLKKIDPSAHPLCASKERAHELTESLQKRMYDLLYLMFAHSKYSLLIIFHGIDASGKDGSVSHIFQGANPQGMKVFSFKQPSLEEARHDFLWRCHKHTPERGLTSIFNRSYYEEVSTVVVHPELLKAQNIPDEILERKDFIQRRFDRINDFELMLTESGTIVLKFFLHISKAEQKERFEARQEDRSKNWKFSAADVAERKFWDEYQLAFESMINSTHTKHAPWTVIPADSKWYRNYIISKTIVDRLEKLKMTFPALNTKKRSK